MKRIYSIKKNEDFVKARSRGKTYRNRQFTLNRSPNDLTIPRFGFIITKKVGKAHERNLLRRRLKALVRDRVFSVEKGFDYILIPRPHTLSIPFAELEKNLDHVLSLPYRTKKR